MGGSYEFHSPVFQEICLRGRKWRRHRIHTWTALVICFLPAMARIGTVDGRHSGEEAQAISASGSTIFPSVHVLSEVPIDFLVSPFCKKTLSQMDLLDISCPTSSTLCQVSTLFHTRRELDYFESQFARNQTLPQFRQSHQGIHRKREEDALFSLWELDEAATEAIVLGPRRARSLELSDSNAEILIEVDNNFSVNNDTAAEESGSFSSTPLDSYSRIPGFDCFLDYDGMMDWLLAKVQTAPSHLSVSLLDVGDSYLKTQDANAGHDIVTLQLTASESIISRNDRAPILIITGLHAREYSPPEIIRRWLELFWEPTISLELETILQTSIIYWIPYANPDGRVLAETTQPLRRKNLNQEANGAESCQFEEFGVDLNRNFPFRWGLDNGSSDFACDQTFRGQSAGSEPEIMAIVNIANQIFPAEQGQPAENLKSANFLDYNENTTTGMFLDIHAFGNYYIYPWGFENRETPNHEGLTAMAAKLRAITNYQIRGPGSSYTSPASGASDDWAYSTFGAAGNTWEVGDSFSQDCKTFEEEIVDVNLSALLYFSKLAWRPYRMAKGPDVSSVVVSADQISFGEELTVRITATNGAYSIAKSTGQAIQSILIYVDELPHSRNMEFPHWILGSKEISEDGEADFRWSWEDLAQHWALQRKPLAGEHRFYFLAINSAGYTGTLNAVSVEVDNVPTAFPINEFSDFPTLEPSIAPSIIPSVSPTSTDPSSEPSDAVLSLRPTASFEPQDDEEGDIPLDIGPIRGCDTDLDPLCEHIKDHMPSQDEFSAGLGRRRGSFVCIVIFTGVVVIHMVGWAS